MNLIPLLATETALDFESHVPPTPPAATPPPAWLHAVDGVLLFALLAFGSWVVMRGRSPRLLLISQLLALAWYGFFRHGCLCPVGSVGNISVGLLHPGQPVGVMAVVFFFLPLAFTLVCGRVFCGAACPMGAVQELLGGRARAAKSRITPRAETVLRAGRWIFLGAAVASAAAWMSLPICRYDPFVTLFRLTGPWPMVVFTAAFLLLCILVSRPYCRWLCPYGAILGVFSRLAWHRRVIDAGACVRCRKCEKSCPMHAIRDNTVEQPHCIQCGQCSSVCRKDAVKDVAAD